MRFTIVFAVEATKSMRSVSVDDICRTNVGGFPNPVDVPSGNETCV